MSRFFLFQNYFTFSLLCFSPLNYQCFVLLWRKGTLYFILVLKFWFGVALTILLNSPFFGLLVFLKTHWALDADENFRYGN